jgi:hypothetical protein
VLLCHWCFNRGCICYLCLQLASEEPQMHSPFLPCHSLFCFSIRYILKIYSVYSSNIYIWFIICFREAVITYNTKSCCICVSTFSGSYVWAWRLGRPPRRPASLHCYSVGILPWPSCFCCHLPFLACFLIHPNWRSYRLSSCNLMSLYVPLILTHLATASYLNVHAMLLI